VNTNPTQAREAGSAANSPARQLGKKLLLLLPTTLFCAALFLALDWLYTTRVPRAALRVTGQGLGCFTIRDTTRVFALKPDCSCIRAWDGERYQLTTNSLGFHDRQIREVPPIDAKPRVLMLGDSFTEGTSLAA
jgi:hypothetical protein